MKRFILALALALACVSASAQYIKEDLKLEGGRRKITGTPCMIYHDGQPFMMNYKYLATGEDKVMILEVVCGCQQTWWTVNEGATGLVKILGGGLQSMTVTGFDFDMAKNIMTVTFTIYEDLQKQTLGITELLFRTSSGEPSAIKIPLDERSQEHLHKSYLEIMARAGL